MIVAVVDALLLVFLHHFVLRFLKVRCFAENAASDANRCVRIEESAADDRCGDVADKVDGILSIFWPMAMIMSLHILCWLVAWNIFVHILGTIIPTDFHIFQRG